MTKYISILFVLCVVFMTPVWGQDMSDKRMILDARERSNQAIANHDVNGIMAEIDFLFQATGGEGGFVSSRDQMNELFSDELGGDSKAIYIRTPESVEISVSGTRGFETGKWAGGDSSTDGELLYGGNYSAFWIKSDGKWKLRSEIFVTLYSN